MIKKFTFWLKFAPLITSAILIVVVLLLFRFLPVKLPLFYSLPWGEGQLATQKEFLIIPGVMILITLLNFVVSSQLHFSQKFFKDILYIASLSVTLILLITFIKVSLMFA
ncbi:MAG: hypothetical protein Q7R77_02630 [Candidatus Daviesbacteria bacterium]|nr:hypothetical protein [Candidatus Daviesbacteria bacterium]